MDFRERSNRPVSRPVATAPEPAVAATPAAERYTAPRPQQIQKRNGGKKAWLITALLVTLLVLAGLAMWFKVGPFASAATGVDKDKYQAVFLVNDQVYFGKITQVNDDILVLNDIYYLQQTQAKAEGANQNQNAASAEEPNTSLAKLGNELHAPQDEMRINMDQVLFWENLKDDGKVVQAIKNDKQ